MSVTRRNYVLFGFLAAAILGSAPAALAQEGASTGAYRFALVQRDLDSAMRNEALDAEKYVLFARQARERGNHELAAVFERVADRERGAHLQALASLSAREMVIDQAEQQAELAKLPARSDEANLRDAMRAERFDANEMRSELVNRALKYGDVEVAQTFLNVGQGEIKNLLEFRSALKQLKRSQKEGVARQS